jgi:hypothetical protein
VAQPTDDPIDALVKEVPEGERIEIREYLHMDAAHQRISTHRRTLDTARTLEGLRGHVDDRFDQQDEAIAEVLRRLDNGPGFWRQATYPLAMMGTGVAAWFGRDIPR